MPKYPDLCTEIHRYDKPEDIYRFFTLVPREVSHQHMNYRPFQNREVMGIDPTAQNYVEIERHQLYSDPAQETRDTLVADGYRPVPLAEVPLALAQFVIGNQAPIEFQSKLSAGDKKWLKRIVVWVRGELPE